MSRTTDPLSCLVENILKLDRPFIEKIKRIVYGSDFRNRKRSILDEDGTLENLIVHNILHLGPHYAGPPT